MKTTNKSVLFFKLSLRPVVIVDLYVVINFVNDVELVSLVHKLHLTCKDHDRLQSRKKETIIDSTL